MTGYASIVLRMMLAWVRNVASWLWSLIGSSEGSRLTSWLLSNIWIIVLSVLVIGTVIDLIVHLFRWHPLQVYRSFFNRMRHADHEAELELTEQEEETYSFSNDAMMYEQTATEEKKPASTVRTAPGPVRQLMNQLPQVLTSSDDELIRYRPAQPAVDKSEAYREPVYPVKEEFPASGSEASRRRRRRSV